MAVMANEHSSPTRRVPEEPEESAEAAVTRRGDQASSPFGIGYLACCGGLGCVMCLGEACP